MIRARCIPCVNDAGFVMNSSVRRLDQDGKWNTSSWNGGTERSSWAQDVIEETNPVMRPSMRGVSGRRGWRKGRTAEGAKNRERNLR